MGRIFFVIALIFFFLAAVGSSLLPAAEAWGLVCLTLGFLTGSDWPVWATWRRSPPG